ncbi:MAG: FeoA family protein [Eubacteriales bacterium]
MNKKATLAELTVGESAVVSSIDSGNYIRRRLRDLGLINGTTVECIMKSPLGDPAAYLIRGAVIALRNEDSCVVRLS